MGERRGAGGGGGDGDRDRDGDGDVGDWGDEGGDNVSGGGGGCGGGDLGMDVGGGGGGGEGGGGGGGGDCGMDVGRDGGRIRDPKRLHSISFGGTNVVEGNMGVIVTSPVVAIPALTLLGCLVNTESLCGSLNSAGRGQRAICILARVGMFDLIVSVSKWNAINNITIRSRHAITICHVPCMDCTD